MEVADKAQWDILRVKCLHVVCICMGLSAHAIKRRATVILFHKEMPTVFQWLAHWLCFISIPWQMIYVTLAWCHTSTIDTESHHFLNNRYIVTNTSTGIGLSTAKLNNTHTTTERSISRLAGKLTHPRGRQTWGHIAETIISVWHHAWTSASKSSRKRHALPVTPSHNQNKLFRWDDQITHSI